MSDPAYSKILVAICIWREARGESLEAKRAVGWSIRNRVLADGWFGKGWVDVVLKPWQFSSFNYNDPNASRLPHENSGGWEECLQVAADVIAGEGTDPVSGATHYHDKSLDDKLPPWAVGQPQIASIGNLRFYKVN